MADLKAELKCSICLDVFQDPVTLWCGHNFCRRCIDHAWETLSNFYMCPQCRKRFRSRPVLSKNINLSNIAEHFHSTQEENDDTDVFCNYCDLSCPAVKTCLQCETSMCKQHLQNHNWSVQHTLLDPTNLENQKCPIHKKILGYYCTVDESCICFSCCLDSEHRDHQVEPLNEASEKKKERLRKLVETMNSDIEETEREVQHLQEDMRKVEEKAGVVTKRVHDRFREVRRQLLVLEETLVTDILLKKEETLNPYEKLIQELEKKKDELLMSKRRAEALCHETNPFSVLQEQQSSTGDIIQGERSCKLLHNAGGLDVRLISKTLQIGLCDIMLGLNIWFYIQKPADLVLDTTTAAYNIQVSDDLKTVNHSETIQNIPEKNEGFEGNQVVSTRSFNSERYYWEVETSDYGNWGIGVCYSSMDRRGDQSSLGCNNKSWCLQRCDGRLMVLYNGHIISLPSRASCNGVRVYLDYNGGRLSFYELSNPVRYLYTVSVTFTEPLHAAFMVQNSWLRIRNEKRRLHDT
ncbi:E3 ubiquitin/ISG15 ligase TRIM25-like [Leptodactylus fuscus]|uniref:E3 ubiquitin/ISG15 ligase TRIM25-like n=1 Tax=Leptodactylus fuscus TaxID=238119 RepID=UPI003F4E8732